VKISINKSTIKRFIGNNMSHLDMGQINELKDLMEEDFPDLVNTYLIDCDEKIIELSSAISSKNYQLSADISHSLKGSSANICAETLSVFFKNIEDNARDNNFNKMDEFLNSAQIEYRIVKDQLQNLC